MVEVDDAAGVVDPRASSGRGGSRAGELERWYGRSGCGDGRVAGGRGQGAGGGAAAGADFVAGDGGREVDGLDSQDEHCCSWVRWAFWAGPFSLLLGQRS